MKLKESKPTDGHPSKAHLGQTPTDQIDPSTLTQSYRYQHYSPDFTWVLGSELKSLSSHRLNPSPCSFFCDMFNIMSDEYFKQDFFLGGWLFSRTNLWNFCPIFC